MKLCATPLLTASVRMHGTNLILIATFLFGYGAVAKARVCKVHFIEQNIVQIADGENLISLVGWRHLSHQTVAALGDSLQEAYDKAYKLNDCATATSHLRQALVNQSVDFERSQKVYSIIEQFDRSRKVDALALEASPEQTASAESASAQNQVGMDRIISSCPGMKSDLERLRSLAKGPEAEFRQMRRSKIPLLSVEDDAIKMANLPALERLTKLNFKLELSQLTPAGQTAAKHMQALANAELTVPPAVIATIADFEKEPATNARLRAWIAEYAVTWSSVMKGANARNVAIAKNLRSVDGHIVMAIGEAHVADLAVKITQLCEQDETP